MGLASRFQSIGSSIGPGNGIHCKEAATVYSHILKFLHHQGFQSVILGAVGTYPDFSLLAARSETRTVLPPATEFSSRSISFRTTPPLGAILVGTPSSFSQFVNTFRKCKR
ncbi:hypothetical protein L6164_021843 [Bauhinia variegata]|uniref:Uncharacterized protein n=1 Tax=Bauhinia variegata TaxID=167791 RepID=A0ACB9MD30_BAUVA|nr:hypothetical protein L6164_021843 [Bauhinia variegata]